MANKKPNAAQVKKAKKAMAQLAKDLRAAVARWDEAAGDCLDYHFIDDVAAHALDVIDVMLEGKFPKHLVTTAAENKAQRNARGAKLV